MPRLARLDAPGVLHHVIGRGIEQRKIFLSDIDRNDSLGRLSALSKDGAMEIFAWVLMPNHFQGNSVIPGLMLRDILELRILV